VPGWAAGAVVCTQEPGSGTAPAPAPAAVGRCGWVGGRRRLYGEPGAVAEAGMQALRSEVEEPAYCMFASEEACTEALACRQALEEHRLALGEHRRVPVVVEACMQA